MPLCLNPWLGIKQIPGRLVKLRSFLVLASASLPALLPTLVLGTLAASSISWPKVAHADEETVPEIEAKTFNVKVTRRSRSGNVYVFVTPEAMDLHAGKILLLRQNDQPVMAFRVLRDYPEKNQFAAKWVRRYGNTTRLELDQGFLAIEKVADREAPPLSMQEKAELEEVESLPPPPPVPEEAPSASPLPSPPSSPFPPPLPSPSPSASEAVTQEQIPPPAPEAPPPAKKFDPQLDESTSPPPQKLAAENPTAELTAADEADIDDLKSLTAEELVPMDRYWNGVTVGYGIFRNNGSVPGASSGYNGGLDLKYARTLKELIYFKRKDLQDSFAIEGGLGYYKLISFAAQNDSYSVIPFTVTGRYNLLFSEDLSVFMYAGLNKNFVAHSQPSNSTAVAVGSSQLNSLLPAVGAGMLFRIGPGWYMRLDAGLDLIGIALHLRY